LEKWTPPASSILARDFFVGGTSYPPHGQLPISLENELHPEERAIKVAEDHFILLRETFEEAFKFPTEQDC
jgi:hypothetical protein